MKIGLIARADNTGLGVQTHEFYKHMHPYKTMVVDISRLNGNKQFYDRYPDIHTTQFITGFPTDDDIRNFLQELDVVFLAEAPYNFALYSIAKEMGVKVANQYNYEFFDWFVSPDLPKPDMLIAPSRWEYTKIQAFCDANNIRHTYLHCPVNREVLPYRQIRQARTFLHIAGKPAANDRNGTMTVIEAAKHLKTDAVIHIHFQGNQGLQHQATHSVDDYKKEILESGGRVIFDEFEYPDYADIYKYGDVMLLPRRYGGNCLPMNEAMSVGMPVIMTDISPNTQMLPNRWLVPATKIGEFTPRTTIDIYEANAIKLAEKIDEFYNMTDSEMFRENITANALAADISWDKMKEKYDKALADLCTL